MPRTPTVPSYRLHKPSGQAVVTIRTAAGERRDVYLGDYNSPESRQAYARVIAEAASAPAAVLPIGSTVTIDELLLQFFKHADVHYRRRDGTPTSRLKDFKFAARPLHEIYGNSLAVNFGPLALRTVRQKFIDVGNARTTVNARVGMVRLIFRWAASPELIPASVPAALSTVAGLQQGRSPAMETAPVGPVPDELVDATLPYLTSEVRGLVQFQRLTGARPGEACALRPCDIDITGDVWIYRPAIHKNSHKGKARILPVGPGASSC